MNLGIAEALETCRGADVVLLCVGEAAAMSGEAASRADLGLPGRQEALARAVSALGRPWSPDSEPVAAPLTLPWLFEAASAVVATWFPGAEAGTAIADVLTGVSTRSGGCRVTWPRCGGADPDFLRRPAFRAPFDPADSLHQQISRYFHAPQFHFGHGLSYSHFAISNLSALQR